MTITERAQELIKDMMHSSGQSLQPMIERAFAAAIEAEREACAQVADAIRPDIPGWQDTGSAEYITRTAIVEAIRARGKGVDR